MNLSRRFACGCAFSQQDKQHVCCCPLLTLAQEAAELRVSDKTTRLFCKMIDFDV